MTQLQPRRTQAKRTAPATGRILRVAELISADAGPVRAAAADLPTGVSAMTAELAAGTLLTLEQRRRWWDRRPRKLALARLEQKLRHLEQATAQQTVVAAAIIDNHRVLVAQRSHPEALAGQWEFPGGKAERGETPAAALIRECAEELGCRIRIGPELARQRLPTGATLILLAAQLDRASPRPQALEHLQVRWVAAEELIDLDWVATNRQYVADVTARL